MSVIEDTGRVESVVQQIKELLEINARQAAVIERPVAHLVTQRAPLHHAARRAELGVRSRRRRAAYGKASRDRRVSWWLGEVNG